MGLKERREREKIERRKQILDAARRVLFQKGIIAASMNLIAKEAELSVGTLYLYFKNKEELFAALQREGLDILLEMIKNGGDKGKCPADSLEKMALAYYDFSREQKKYFEIMNYFLASPKIIFPADLKTVIDNYGIAILDLFEDVIRKGTKNPEEKKKEIRHYAVMFIATLHGLLQFRKLQTTVLSGQAFKDLYMESATRLSGCISDRFFK